MCQCNLIPHCRHSTSDHSPCSHSTSNSGFCGCFGPDRWLCSYANLSGSPCAIQTPRAGTLTTQASAVSVAPAARKKYKGKSEEGEGPSSEAGGSEPEIIVRSLTLEKSRGVGKDFRWHEGEPVTTWLIRCCDNGADRLDLEGREATRLESVAREGGIDKAIGKNKETRSFWRQILSTVKSRCPFKGDIVCRGEQY